MKKILLALIVISIILMPQLALGSTQKIVVNKAYHLLYVESGSNIDRVIPVCIGEGGESETPTGQYTIASIVKNPTWYFEGKTYSPYIYDKGNGLGVVWMGISLPSYGLHGTNEPFSIGGNFSHGCVRMENTDVQFLSSISFIGENVEIKEGTGDQIAKHLKTINALYSLMNVLNGAK
ncbi:MAG: L,D-transpeptidase [Caldisericaceae bacterium]